MERAERNILEAIRLGQAEIQADLRAVKEEQGELKDRLKNLDERVWKEATGATRKQAEQIAENRVRSGIWGGGVAAAVAGIAEALRMLTK